MTKRSVLIGTVLVAAISGAVRADAVAHWDFDRTLGGNYIDRVNNAHPATPKDKDAVKPFTGKAPFGGAITLDGSPNSFLTIPALKNIQTTSFTVAAWVNMNTPGPNFVLTDWVSAKDAGFVFGTDPLKDRSKAEPIADLASKELPTTGNNRTSRLSVIRLPVTAKTVPLSEWHHMAWTWNREAGILTTYLDGASIGTAKRQGTRGLSKTLDLAINDHEMRIGSREWINGVPTAPVFNGSLDELWIFNTALSEDQLSNLIKFNDITGPPPVVARVDPVNTPTPAVGDSTPPVRVVPQTPTVTPDVPVATLPPRNELTEVTPAAVAPKATAGKTAGVIACLVWAISLSTYLGWGLKERAKLKAAGKL